MVNRFIDVVKQLLCFGLVISERTSKLPGGSGLQRYGRRGMGSSLAHLGDLVFSVTLDLSEGGSIGCFDCS